MFRFQRVALALLTATVVTPVVASDLLIPFPAGTVVSRTAGPPALCRVVVQGYTFDSTLLGAGNAASTCTASNVLSPNPPGSLIVGKYGTSPAVGGYVNLSPPSGLRFALTGLRVSVYGPTNTLTLSGTDSLGIVHTQALATAAGTTDVVIPASAGMNDLIGARIESSNERFEITNVQISDTGAALPSSFNDSWRGNGYGGTTLENAGATTVAGAVVQMFPEPARFRGTVTGGSILYVLPSGKTLTANTVTWRFEPRYPLLPTHSTTATLTAIGTGVDEAGYPFTLRLSESVRLYNQFLTWHYGPISGEVSVTY